MLHFFKEQKEWTFQHFLCVRCCLCHLDSLCLAVKRWMLNALRNAIKHKLQLMTHTQSFHFQFTAPTSFCGFRLILLCQKEWGTRERSKLLACVMNKLTLNHTHTHCTKHDPRGECDVMLKNNFIQCHSSICVQHTQRPHWNLEIFQILHFYVTNPVSVNQWH